MAFERKQKTEKENFEFPSLMDVVFLLLIFFLATLSFTSSGGKSPIPSLLPFPLPEAEGSRAVREREILETLLIQIEHRDEKNPQSPKVVYILRPSPEDSLTFSQALKKAKEDSSLHAEFFPDTLRGSREIFEQCRACGLIGRAIEDHKNKFFQKPSPANYIEIRAVKSTEFRVINFIMEKCSRDTIPKLVFRTSLRATEEQGAF